MIPIVLQVALGQRDKITIFGDDYATDDGTCVRDYIHIDDLGDAHLRALEKLEPGKGLCVNLGTGRGTSVREIVEACREVTGHPIPEVMGERRAGDPPQIDRRRPACQRAARVDAQIQRCEIDCRNGVELAPVAPQGIRFGVT